MVKYRVWPPATYLMRSHPRAVRRHAFDRVSRDTARAQRPLHDHRFGMHRQTRAQRPQDREGSAGEECCTSHDVLGPPVEEVGVISAMREHMEEEGPGSYYEKAADEQDSES